MNPNPLIIALDFDNAAEVLRIIDTLGDAAGFYKVGMELYAAEGMPLVRDILDRGKQVFLDLKLYDIGETVKRAVAAIAKSSVTFLTVHGSQAVMRAAVEGRGNSALKLLGVSVLTSFDQQDLTELGYPCTVSDLVALRTRNAIQAGLEGMVCSALEASAVRTIAGPQAIIVTPGVRSRSAKAGDQKRIATPAEALSAGADYLVIGRQVTRAEDPRAEALRVLAECQLAQPAATPSR